MRRSTRTGGQGGCRARRSGRRRHAAPFISREHPQTIALILSQLESAQSAGILGQLPERMQSDVSYRIATMESITPAILKDVEEALEDSLRDILSGNQDVGGPKVVADMLNMTGSSTERNVMGQMDAQAPDVAEAVRNLMFTFADIAKLTDREIQLMVEAVDQKDLIALTAAGDALRATRRILHSMNEETRAFIEKEMGLLTRMRLSEVEECRCALCSWCGSWRRRVN